MVGPLERGHQGTSMGHSSARRKRSGPMDGNRVLMHDSQGRNSAHLVWSRPAPSLGVGRPAEGRGLGTRHAWPVQQGGLVISSLCAYVMALLGSADAARHAVATWPSAAVTSVAAGEPGGMGTPGAGLCEVAGIPALLADYMYTTTRGSCSTTGWGTWSFRPGRRGGCTTGWSASIGASGRSFWTTRLLEAAAPTTATKWAFW